MSDKIEKLPAFPENDERSFGYRALRASIEIAGDAIPFAKFATPALQELLDAKIGAPLEKRREAWFVLLGAYLDKLDERVIGLDPESLGQNPEFVRVVTEVSQKAIQPNNKEKLEAFQNIVLNTALGVTSSFEVTLDDVMRGTFIGYVDRFSALHIAVLRLLANPTYPPEVKTRKYYSIEISLLEDALEVALPQTSYNKDSRDRRNELIERVVADLTQEGLVKGVWYSNKFGGHPLQRYATTFGDAFLEFISKPSSLQ
jgi:hypothetical protein